MGNNIASTCIFHILREYGLSSLSEVRAHTETDIQADLSPNIGFS